MELGLWQGCPSPTWGPCPGTRTISHVWTPHPCRYFISSSEASQAGPLSLQGAARLVSIQAWTRPRCRQQPCDYRFEDMPAACTPSPVWAPLGLGRQHPGWHVGGTSLQELQVERREAGSLSRSALLLCSSRKPHPNPGIGPFTRPSQVLSQAKRWGPAAAPGGRRGRGRGLRKEHGPFPGPQPAHGSLPLTLQAVPLPHSGFQQECGLGECGGLMCPRPNSQTWERT